MMTSTNTVREAFTDDCADFSAPLAGATAGHLLFRNGASHVTIGSRSGTDELFGAHFEGVVPDVAVDGGTVAIRYRRLSTFDWARFALMAGEHGADIALAASVPWLIEVRGGVSRLDGDLGALELSGLEIRGGASHIELVLGQPRGVVPIRVRGGASHVSIWRPADVAVRATVRGGVSRLALDEQRFGAVGGLTQVATGDWRQATSGYDVEIGGGASHLTIGAR